MKNLFSYTDFIKENKVVENVVEVKEEILENENKVEETKEEKENI